MDTHTGQHWLRRGLAFFLILTLLLSMSSVGVFAETNENEKTPVFTKKFELSCGSHSEKNE